MESKVLVEYCSTTANLGRGRRNLSAKPQKLRNWIHWYLFLALLKSLGYFKEWLDASKIMRSASTNLFPALICAFKELCAPSAKCIHFFVSLIIMFLFFFFYENIEISAEAEWVNSALLALESEIGAKRKRGLLFTVCISHLAQFTACDVYAKHCQWWADY